MQKSKEMAERTCVACKKKDEKENFIRFVEVDNKPLPDIKGTFPGRGFNVCPSKNCIKLFIKKIFKGKVNSEEIITLTEEGLKNYLLSLISIAHKSRLTVIGQDSIKKLKEEGTLILAHDLSEKTKRNLKRENLTVIDNILSKEEIGNAVKKETQIGALFIKRSGIERKIAKIGKKLKSLMEE